MSGKKILYPFIILIISSLTASAFGQEQENSDSGSTDSNSGIGIFFNFGGGFTNNLRLSDWMNRMAYAQEIIIGGEEDKEKSDEPLFYGGYDLEARLFSGNIVYGPAFGYYNVSRGYREVVGNSTTFKQNVSLDFYAFRGTIYYKISYSNRDFLLLGGGFGYYSGTLEHEFGYYSDSGNSVNTSEDSTWTIGWHTCIEYNSRIFDSFAFSIGTMQRFAEALQFDVDNSNDDSDDDINAGLTGLYFYIGLGYLF